MSFGAPGLRPGAAAAQAQGGRPQLPGGGVPRPLRLQYTGVARGPGGGGWMARVLVDPDRGSCRTVGPFPDPHAAALAHDRLAIAYLGDRARPNFPAAFHPIEERFLRLCRAAPEGKIDVCALVADPSKYEDRYATFLRSVLRLKQWGDFMGLIVEFFTCRADEIGDDILRDNNMERLEARFVEMHRNKAVDPKWRDSYIRRVLQEQNNQLQQQQQQQQRHLQQQIAATAVQPQQQHWGGSATAVPVQPQPHQQQQIAAAAVQPQVPSSSTGAAVPPPCPCKCNPISSSRSPPPPCNLSSGCLWREQRQLSI